MKIKINGEMREKMIIGIGVVTFAFLLYFIFMHFSSISSFVNQVFSIFASFIIGFSIAFLLNPLVMFIENKIFGKWKFKKKRIISVFIAFIISFLLVGSLVYVMAQSTIESISDLIKNHQSYIQDFTKLVTNFISGLGLGENLVDSIVGVSDQLIIALTDGIPSILSGTFSFVGVFVNILIGIVSSIYMLLDKDRFVMNVKKVVYAYLPLGNATYIKTLGRTTKEIFYNFIIGKMIDSTIIGIIAFIGLSLLRIEYAGLLSVIIGVTNMIPVFGPFIGAVPGMLLLLIISPEQCIIFMVFVLILQQFDGNILGPLILGDKLGLPSFWVLFSVTIGGTLFGVLGMFIGVPVFALFYFLIREHVNFMLRKKGVTDEEIEA